MKLRYPKIFLMFELNEILILIYRKKRYYSSDLNVKLLNLK